MPRPKSGPTPKAWLGAAPGRRWSALTDAVCEASWIRARPLDRFRGAPRPGGRHSRGVARAAYGLSLRQRGQPNRARHGVTSDQAALFGDYVDLILVAETTPLVAQRGGRRQRGLVVSLLRAERLNTENLQPTISPL